MNKKGFTLIELIVVIAIIGLLSTLAVVALSSARLKARDSIRLSDLKQMQTALELHYTDTNIYPATNGTLGVAGTAFVCLDNDGWQALADCDADPYMGKVPADPQGNAYVYTVNGNTYTITATLEGTTNGLTGNIKLTPAGISVVAAP